MQEVIFKYATKSDSALIDMDDSTRTIVGYASVFNNIDSSGDVITKGAYSKSIKESFDRVTMLWQHDQKQPIARPKELVEDYKGLMHVTNIPDTTLGNDVYKLYKEKVMTDFSVGIWVVKSDYDSQRNRIVKEAGLKEYSAVTWGANDLATTIAVKALTENDSISGLIQLEEFLKKGTYSDELYLQIENKLLEIKSLMPTKVQAVQKTLETKPSDQLIQEVLKQWQKN